MRTSLLKRSPKEAARKTLRALLLQALPCGRWIVKAPDHFRLDLSCADFGGEALTIRNLKRDDLDLLLGFRDRLSAKSRELFCPYPWENEPALKKALATAIDNADKKIDAAYLILAGGAPVGHFFLWKAGGNPASRARGVEVPELGVAVADAFQGRGLGSLSVAVLKAVAMSARADAIELTTDLSNAGGWSTYLKAGFRHIGNILNPLGVDVTAVDEGRVAPCRFRQERQMVYIIDRSKENAVLEYLASKRKNYEKSSLPHA